MTIKIDIKKNENTILRLNNDLNYFQKYFNNQIYTIKKYFVIDDDFTSLKYFLPKDDYLVEYEIMLKKEVLDFIENLKS